MQWILNNISMGKNIQTTRMKRNMTQADLVIKMQLKGSNMSRSTLANIESGRRNIRASDLRIIKEILAVEYDELFAVDAEQASPLESPRE